MELDEMLRVSPNDYLHQGYLTAEGKLRDGINGIHSLAIAYQCREEAVDLERFQEAMQQISAGNLDMPVLKEKIESLHSAALKKVFQASESWISDRKQYAAFVSHLQRILSQLALLLLTPAEAT